MLAQSTHLKSTVPADRYEPTANGYGELTEKRFVLSFLLPISILISLYVSVLQCSLSGVLRGTKLCLEYPTVVQW